MSVQWMAVQIIGDTLRLPIASEANLDKPFGRTSIGRDVERIVVNPFSDSQKSFEPERGECHIECFDDGVDEALDGSMLYRTPRWFLSCGHEVEGSERPNFCSTCGKKVVDA